MADQRTVVDLLRHGEPLGGRRIRGQLDDPLAEQGWRQKCDTVGDAAPWRHVVTSPLQRRSAFARALADKHLLSLSLEPRFKEIGFGAWEGQAPEEIQQWDGARFRRYRDEPLAFMPEGAESVTDFVARVAQGWQNMLAALRGRRVLVVCHAGVIRAASGLVLGAVPVHLFHVQVDYAGLTRIEVSEGQRSRLVFHGGRLS